MANTKHTTVHHLHGKRFLGLTSNQQQVLIDGTAELKIGMTPMDLLLNAVGSCAAFDIVGMIEKRKLTIHSYQIALEGSRNEGTPAYYTHIHAKHMLNVPGLERAMAERFVDLGMNKYCSVAASLKAEISFEVVLEHAENPENAPTQESQN